MKKFIFSISLFVGTLVTIWSCSTLLAGLAEANWSVSVLTNNYLTAVGLTKEFHTMSDFYTYIKGIEYLIAVSFLVTFPAFFKYLNKTKELA